MDTDNDVNVTVTLVFGRECGYRWQAYNNSKGLLLLWLLLSLFSTFFLHIHTWTHMALCGSVLSLSSYGEALEKIKNKIMLLTQHSWESSHISCWFNLLLRFPLAQNAAALFITTVSSLSTADAWPRLCCHSNK